MKHEFTVKIEHKDTGELIHDEDVENQINGQVIFLNKPDGYYWAMRNSKWIIAEYNSGFFYIHGIDDEFRYLDFQEVNPNQIIIP